MTTSTSQLDGHHSKNTRGVSTDGTHTTTRIHPSMKRPRAPIACFRCHHKKVRCDGAHPNCTRCLSTGVLCAYPSSRRSRNTQPTNVDPFIENLSHLETRIRRIENDLNSQRARMLALFESHNNNTHSQSQAHRTGRSGHRGDSNTGNGNDTTGDGRTSPTGKNKITPKPSTAEIAADLATQMRKTEQDVQESRSIIAQLRLRGEQRFARGKRGSAADGMPASGKHTDDRTASFSSTSSTVSPLMTSADPDAKPTSSQSCLYSSGPAGVYSAVTPSLCFRMPGHTDDATHAEPLMDTPYLQNSMAYMGPSPLPTANHDYSASWPFVASNAPMVYPGWPMFHQMPHTPLAENDTMTVTHTQGDGHDDDNPGLVLEDASLQQCTPKSFQDDAFQPPITFSASRSRTSLSNAHHPHTYQQQALLGVSDALPASRSSSTNSTMSTFSQPSFSGHSQHTPLYMTGLMSQWMLDDMPRESSNTPSDCVDPYAVF